MRFRVESLGPLREAEVDLGPRLIVLTGPNNTGKTYFATALYGLSQVQLSVGLPAAVSALVQDAARQGRFTVTVQELAPLLGTALRSRTAELAKHLDECFGAADGTFSAARITTASDPGDVSRALADLPRRAWGYKRASGIGYVRRTLPGEHAVEFAIVEEGVARRYGQSKRPPSDEAWARLPTVGQEIAPEDASRRARTALGTLVDQLAIPRTHIFPAERIAINLFAREIAGARTARVDELLGADADEGPAARLSWPIRDAVQAALRLPDDAKRTGPFADLAEELEREILGGAVGVSQYGAATFTPHRSAQPIDVQQSASVVKSLASIVFYFRHRARAGDFLVIDEPELNLHPDNQRKVARFLALAIHRGFRILASTHSDYVLRELSHLLMLGRPDDRARRLAKELGYPEAALLTPNDVGVYLFQDGAAKPLAVSEDGFEVKTIEDEIAKLNEVSQKIYAGLLD